MEINQLTPMLGAVITKIEGGESESEELRFYSGDMVFIFKHRDR